MKTFICYIGVDAFRHTVPASVDVLDFIYAEYGRYAEYDLVS